MALFGHGTCVSGSVRHRYGRHKQGRTGLGYTWTASESRERRVLEGSQMRFGSFVFPVSHTPERDGAVIDDTLEEIELAEALGPTPFG